MATKQKSVEDYRNAVKLLKLKVIKLQKVNDDLTDKLREQGIPVITDDGKSSGPLTNQNVMLTFGRSCKRLGLTPEMLFRAADSQVVGSIKVEDFRLFLSKVRLGLNASQLTLLVRILDEDCSGVVKKEEYYDCLQAYGINEEKNGTGTRTFGQEALLKYARILLGIQISPEDSFKKMDTEGKGTVIPSVFRLHCINDYFFSNFVHAIDSNQTVSEKEIVASFNHIDLDKQGTLQRFFYEQEVRKAMKAAASDLGVNPSTMFGKTGQSFNMNPTPQLLQTQTLQVPFVQQAQNEDLNKSQNMSQEASKNEFKGDKKLIAAMCTKLQTQGINVIEFVRGIVQNLNTPSAGIMLYDVYQAFDKTGKKISKTDQLKLFQLLDAGENGSVDYDELMLFFHEIRKDSDGFDGLFEIVTRKLQAIEFDIALYLAIEQIYEDTELTMDQFFPIAEQLFMVPDRSVSDALFKSMDADGAGILSASEIISAVRKIMDIFVPPPVISGDQAKELQLPELNLGEYNEILNALKPTVTDNDYFDKYSFQEKRGIIKKKWKTIFNSDLACLRRCYEIIADLKPGEKWSDPEFGSTPTDEFGSKSMYFADNDIPVGNPDPKEVKWLRPNEIINILIQNGYDDLKGKTADVFDGGGAGSNDVCQSKFLGNCWFVSALSIIARFDKYLQGEFVITKESVEDLSDKEIQGMQSGVYPPCFQFLRKYGIYVMRFYKNFGWRYVMIDDRLCFKDLEFVYGHCRQPTELWVNLIEKAFAKLHNNYIALTSGDIAQALADMTGLVADRQRLEGSKIDVKEEKEELWSNLINAKKNGTMMGCSAEGAADSYIMINGEDSGIMSGHAYAIIDIFELPDQTCKNYHKSHRLMIIRNPWGFGEWKLKWSENKDYVEKLEKFMPQIDAYFDSEIKKAQDAGVEPPERYKYGFDDGTFIMSFKAWRDLFCNLFQCIKFPEEWSGLRGKDQFGSSTSGVPKNTETSKISFAQKNPQYIMDLNRKDGKETTVYLLLKQLDGRLFWAEKYPFASIMKFCLLSFFKLEPSETCLQKFDAAKMISSSKKLLMRREIDTDNMKLKNGRYAIIPCTKLPGQFVQYSISVYFDCASDEIKLSKFGDSMYEFLPIQEEEETTVKASENMRKLFKKQALDVLNSKDIQ